MLTFESCLGLKCFDFEVNLVLLNKLRCHAHFWFSASQITWSLLLLHICTLNGNSADTDQLASSEVTDLDLHCLQRQGVSRFSRTRVKIKFYCREWYKFLVFLHQINFSSFFLEDFFYICFSVGVCHQISCLFYRNNTKYWDRLALANSGDPDQMPLIKEYFRHIKR